MREDRAKFADHWMSIIEKCIKVKNYRDVFGSLPDFLLVLRALQESDQAKAVDFMLAARSNGENRLDLLFYLFCYVVSYKPSEITIVVNVWQVIIQIFRAQGLQKELIVCLSVQDNQRRNYINYFLFAFNFVLRYPIDDATLLISSLVALIRSITEACSDTTSKHLLMKALFQRDWEGMNALYRMVNAVRYVSDYCKPAIVVNYVDELRILILNACLRSGDIENAALENSATALFDFLRPSLNDYYSDQNVANIAVLIEILSKEIQDMFYQRLDQLATYSKKNYPDSSPDGMVSLLVFNVLYLLMHKNLHSCPFRGDLTIFDGALRNAIAQKLIADAKKTDNARAYLEKYCPARDTGRTTLFSLVVDTHHGPIRKGETSARKAIETITNPTRSSRFFRTKKRRIANPQEIALVSLQI